MAPTTSSEMLLERMTKSRDSRAVQKLEFAAGVSAIPESFKIFAFEGVDDKTIYYYWIRGLAPQLRYEPYLCGGKRKVLQLYDILQDDATGLGSRVYYFVDRDFDELQGREANSMVFSTCRYSVESYVICEKLLEDILVTDFHCQGYPAVRATIAKIFAGLYDEFLKITKDLNFRLYVARRFRIEPKEIPTNIAHIANISLKSVSPPDRTAVDLLPLTREPKPDELQACEAEFASLCAQDRYRGKFALAFFVRWLTLLRTDRGQAEPILFGGVPAQVHAIAGNFSFTTLAPKTQPPRHLSAFLAAI